MAMVFYFCSTPTGKLNGLVTVEFSAGVAAFTDLSINYEGKNYVLNIEAYTVSPSRYQFSSNADPFDVKERVLALVITQQPGKEKKCCVLSFFMEPTG